MIITCVFVSTNYLCNIIISTNSSSNVPKRKESEPSEKPIDFTKM